MLPMQVGLGSVAEEQWQLESGVAAPLGMGKRSDSYVNLAANSRIKLQFGRAQRPPKMVPVSRQIGLYRVPGTGFLTL